FDAVGQTEILAEKDFATFAAIAGCSPAFTFEYIDAMARAAVANGLPKAQAVRIATQAVVGAALLVQERAETPANLADLVQSPGGTTVAGVVALEEAGFGRATVKGVQAAIDRDIALQGN
ncbi:MAG: pyrroline-5-carboxylate reductase, partial [Ancrocorticia sp.]|nr:pyrroline-5-carboxylate reductase [Ancrocorticia sp.]